MAKKAAAAAATAKPRTKSEVFSYLADEAGVSKKQVARVS